MLVKEKQRWTLDSCWNPISITVGRWLNLSVSPLYKWRSRSHLCRKMVRVSCDGPTETLVQRQAHVCLHSTWATLVCGFQCSVMTARTQRRVRKKLAPCSESSIFSQGLCQKPHGRWFIERQLGPGIACPLLQASGTQAAAARDAEYLFRLPELLPPLLQHVAQQEIWWKWGVWTTKGARGIEAQRDHLKPEKGAVWSPESDSQVLVMGAGKQNEVS